MPDRQTEVPDNLMPTFKTLPRNEGGMKKKSEKEIGGKLMMIQIVYRRVTSAYVCVGVGVDVGVWVWV